ncbi:ATP-binding protein [Staphylococcus sp. ACRSN]|uniref:AAA family ATPase n=1 Tax=Staphylococcus sp. ACRSN TaxID=2918214 RepID=UPI001EF27347|nr:ATP-binding protein [Staphylococcus sp. ACRSN]MCG7338735.1 ATP-binding protein [Staphylococcus sp. ACRSN]
MNTFGTLYFLTGKMGAGKSTKSKELEQQHNAVLISEDQWLESLFPSQINHIDDYLKYSQLLKPILKVHIQRILEIGSNVVLDFPGNTKQQRSWLVSIASEINANHKLIFLNISDEQCLKHINQRKLEEPDRAQFDTKETFDYLSSFFEVPEISEGLNIVEIK